MVCSLHNGSAAFFLLVFEKSKYMMASKAAQSHKIDDVAKLPISKTFMDQKAARNSDNFDESKNNNLCAPFSDALVHQPSAAFAMYMIVSIVKINACIAPVNQSK